MIGSHKLYDFVLSHCLIITVKTTMRSALWQLLFLTCYSHRLTDVFAEEVTNIQKMPHLPQLHFLQI